jgi:hypothetical protein
MTAIRLLAPLVRRLGEAEDVTRAAEAHEGCVGLPPASSPGGVRVRARWSSWRARTPRRGSATWRLEGFARRQARFALLLVAHRWGMDLPEVPEDEPAVAPRPGTSGSTLKALTPRPTGWGWA